MWPPPRRIRSRASLTRYHQRTAASCSWFFGPTIPIVDRHLAVLLLFASTMADLSGGQDLCGKPGSVRNRMAQPRKYVRSSLDRIQGGREATPNRWPWTAQLLRDGAHLCGAALIDPSFALTAGHCVASSPDPSRYQLLVGGHVFMAGQRVQVQNISVHPLFDKFFARAYDFALLRFDPPLDLNDGTVDIICLPTWVPPVNTECVVTGWGKMFEDGPRSATLREVRIPLMSPAICGDVWHYPGLIHPATMMCAGFQDGGRDACQGDSGGPMVCHKPGADRYELHGLVSWGFGCGEPNHPGVYSRVIAAVGWIRSEMVLLKRDSFRSMRFLLR